MFPPRVAKGFFSQAFGIQAFIVQALSLHGLGDEFFGGFTQQGIASIARNSFTPDLEHDWYSQWRNVTQLYYA